MKNPLKRIAVREADEYDPPLTPVWEALRDDDEASVCRLLRTGGHDPNQSGPYDGARGQWGPALGYALIWGLDVAVGCLLDAGGDPSAEVDGYPVAGWARSAKGLRLLLAAGADVNLNRTDNGRSVLHELARHSDESTVRSAIECGADIHHLDAWGHTPVFATSSDAVARVLVEAGANPLIEDPTGVQPLYFAAMDGVEDLVVYLLELGCDPLKSNRVNGKNPLSFAVERGHTEVALRMRSWLARS